MNDLKNFIGPQRIICLTEESVETLYLLGKLHLVCGVSAFVKRPEEATKIPKVSFFTSSNYKKILTHKPELILGHSDIQKDIARDLIELGQDVYIANHRSIDGIFKYIRLLSNMVGAFSEGDKLLETLGNKILMAQEFAQSLHRKPKVYFEEWDKPMIGAIQWVSELIELCGGISVTHDKSSGILAKDRFVMDREIIEANPDIILACWCGKKVNIPSIIERDGWSEISAIKEGNVRELAPEIFLQPGPAPILDGIDILIDIFKNYK